MSRGTRDRRRAFTLIELLVVIAIIGLLMAMLLPAIQRARESANRMRCSSNLSQIALAFANFHNDHNYLPTAGLLSTAKYSSQWDDPSQPTQTPQNYMGPKAPPRASAAPVSSTVPPQFLGWAYQVLPYIDQENLHAKFWTIQNPNQPPSSLNPYTLDITIIHSGAALVPLYYCPSRRAPALYNNQPQSDYAGNGGTQYNTSLGCAGELAFDGLLKPNWCDANTNVYYKEVRMSNVADGASNTLLLAEKWVVRNLMETGGQYWDSGFFAGFHPSVIRFARVTPPPAQDALNTLPPSLVENFGSPHVGSLNAVMLDRSVRRIRFGVDPSVLALLSSRADGNPVDWTQVEP
jgi:prepilin-type N-terminal cleavage/methylation domain-containing protein